MAETMLEYLEKEGGISLFEKAFRDVDSLLLCQLAYLKFDGIVPGIQPYVPAVGLEEIRANPKYEQLFAEPLFARQNRRLFEGMLRSRRYRHMKLTGYLNIVDREQTTQVAVVSFILEDGSVFVAFRGTDESAVGWKEDLYLSKPSPAPCQIYGVKYLHMLAEQVGGTIYVGGHSKGGNVALYGAMNCVGWVKSRIKKIYCLDGPGFQPEVLEKCGYGEISDRLVKIVPCFSVVGMILEWDDRFRIVESKAPGLLQHDLFSWVIKEGELLEARELNRGALALCDALNRWLLEVNEERIDQMVDRYFEHVKRLAQVCGFLANT